MFGAHALESDEFLKDLSQRFLAMGRQLDGVANGVYDTAKDNLAGVPAAIALEEFLQRHGFVAVLLVHGGLREDAVDVVQQLVT